MLNSKYCVYYDLDIVNVTYVVYVVSKMSQGIYGYGVPSLSTEVNGYDANVGIAMSLLLLFIFRYNKHQTHVYLLFCIVNDVVLKF